MERKIHNPWTWQDNFGFSQAIEISGHKRVVRCAGQASVDADGNPMHEGDMPKQIEQALNNLEEVLKRAGMTLDNVARLNIFTTDVDLFLSSYGALASRITNVRPASTLLGVTRLAFPPLMVEIEATAVE